MKQNVDRGFLEIDNIKTVLIQLSLKLNILFLIPLIFSTMIVNFQLKKYKLGSRYTKLTSN